jgi:hypothetical protein
MLYVHIFLQKETKQNSSDDQPTKPDAGQAKRLVGG